MLIRSQDKESIVNLSNIESIDICGYLVRDNRVLQDDENANTWYIAYSGYEKMLFIGHYSSKQKAIKVLDMICERYQNSLYCDNMFDNAAQVQRPYIVVSNEVFQMPQDSEV